MYWEAISQFWHSMNKRPTYLSFYHTENKSLYRNALSELKIYVAFKPTFFCLYFSVFSFPHNIISKTNKQSRQCNIPLMIYIYVITIKKFSWSNCSHILQLLQLSTFNYNWDHSFSISLKFSESPSRKIHSKNARIKAAYYTGNMGELMSTAKFILLLLWMHLPEFFDCMIIFP